MERLDKKSAFRCSIAESYINRAYDMQKKELLFDAVDLYMEAIRYNPKSVEAYIGLAYIEYAWGNPENSLKLLNQAKRINPVDIKVNQLREKIKKEFLTKGQ